MANAKNPARKAEAAGAAHPAPLGSVEPLPEWARFVPVALVATGALVITLFLDEPAGQSDPYWPFDASTSAELDSWWSSDEPAESNSWW